MTLAVWVEKTKAWRRPGGDVPPANPMTLSTLRQAFEKRAQTQDAAQLQAWLREQPPRVRREFARIFFQGWPDDWVRLWRSCLQAIRTNARTFWVLLDVMYRSGDERVWPAVRGEWERHLQALVDSCGAEAELWSAYVMAEDPARFVAQRWRQDDGDSVEAILDPFHIPLHSAWHRRVFLAACAGAKSMFFSRWREEFLAGLQAWSDRDRQQAVDAYLFACDPDALPDLTQAIHHQMADPRARPALWEFVGQAQRTKFLRWLADQRLRAFFAEDNERYQFWRTYLHHIDEVVVVDQKQGILMMSSQAVILEGLHVGNATYIYHRRRFEVEFAGLMAQLADPHRALQVKMSSLRNPDAVHRDGHLRHFSGWPMRYASWLQRNLGWEAKG